MPGKLDYLGGGTGHQYPSKSFGRQRGAGRDTYDFGVLQCPRFRCDFFEDFLGDLSPTDIGITGSLYDLSPAGTPTQAVVADAAHGQLQIKLTNDNQQSAAGYSWGDQLLITPNGYPFFETRFNFKTLPTTAEGAIFGLTTAFAGAPITDWSQFTAQITFQLSASGVLRYRVDDATTDSGLVSTGSTLVVDTWYTACFFAKPNGVVEFWLADQYGSNEVKIAAPSVSSTGFAVANLMQPLWWLKKDEGAGTPDVRVDYIRANWHRVTSAIA